MFRAAPSCRLRRAYKNVIDELVDRQQCKKKWKSVLSYGPALEDLRDIYKTVGFFDYDALICMNDKMAFAALYFCKEVGLNIPSDIVVLGFDNLSGT